jgi:hypothetical protein
MMAGLLCFSTSYFYLNLPKTANVADTNRIEFPKINDLKPTKNSVEALLLVLSATHAII